jgi:hypothetical protein
MRFVLFGLLALHGLFHLLGFIETGHFAGMPRMSGETLFTLPEPLSKWMSSLWLLTCVLLLASAAQMIARSDTWWRLGTVAVVLSELLIIYAWPDAKAGTLVNLLLVLPLLAAAAHTGFVHETERKVHALWSDMSKTTAEIVTQSDLAALPKPVQTWLESAGVVGRARTQSVRLKQTGWMRTTPQGAWMPAKAAQYFNVEQPGFVWAVDVRMKAVLPLAGRDSYLQGRGRMLIKLLSLVPVVDASDDKTQQGTLLRFLGELVWFPSAALSPYLHWELIDEHSAKVTMRYRGVSGSALFAFDPHGQVTNVSAERFMSSGPSAKLEHWTIPIREWKNLGGVVIPVAGDVIWKLASGEFNYYRWRVDEVQYNRPELY